MPTGQVSMLRMRWEAAWQRVIRQNSQVLQYGSFGPGITMDSVTTTTWESTT